MAGCPPELMPVLCAVAEAVLDPAFDLTEMQATTHCTAPLILLSGPVVEALGFASGFGALGPGHRANATLGSSPAPRHDQYRRRPARGVRYGAPGSSGEITTA